MSVIRPRKDPAERHTSSAPPLGQELNRITPNGAWFPSEGLRIADQGLSLTATGDGARLEPQVILLTVPVRCRPHRRPRARVMACAPPRRTDGCRTDGSGLSAWPLRAVDDADTDIRGPCSRPHPFVRSRTRTPSSSGNSERRASGASVRRRDRREAAMASTEAAAGPGPSEHAGPTVSHAAPAERHQHLRPTDAARRAPYLTRRDHATLNSGRV